ncbi:MAG: hypothetical protein Q9186_007095 [Xanthomendoza sp. 1 TL-2023]
MRVTQPPVSKEGWKFVKDLLRTVLATPYWNTGPIYGKPGMVHIGSSSQLASDPTDRDRHEGSTGISAQCNMKTAVAMWKAFSIIAGNSWVGYPLAVSLHEGPDTNYARVAGQSVPVTGYRPQELTEHFDFDSQEKASRRNVKGRATLARRFQKDIGYTRPSHTLPDPGRSKTSSCPPFNRTPDQGSLPARFAKWSEPKKSENENRGRRLRKAEDCDGYERYQDTDSDTTLVDDEETPVEKYHGPIIIHGDIEE